MELKPPDSLDRKHEEGPVRERRRGSGAGLGAPGNGERSAPSMANGQCLLSAGRKDNPRREE